MPKIEWGYLMSRWHDQGRVMHALREDGSPTCGASYFYSAGQAEPHTRDHASKCKNCLRLHVVKESG